MNIAQFARLMAEIYSGKKPDIKRIEKLGLLAVKIGQHYALRVDFLREETCLELTKLYRSSSPLPAEEAFALMDRYAPGYRENFEFIDPSPAGSASVGQVHAARLKDGRKTVIKIIKGNFRRSFLRDADSVLFLFKAAVFFYPKLASVFDPVGAVTEIRRYTLAELDLRNELRGAAVLSGIRDRAAAKGYSLDFLKFPEIYSELLGENIMCAQYVPGRTFDELLSAGELKYEELLKLFKAHGYGMFCEGVFHGDIHPGNVILSGKDVYLIDSSAISSVSERLRTGLFKFFEALSVYDYKECALRLNEMADKQITGKDFSLFEEKFFSLYADYKNSTVAEVSLTRKMMQTIRLGVLSGMRFEKGMFPIIKSLMYLDGMVLKCRPGARLVEDMRPYIAEFKKAGAGL